MIAALKKNDCLKTPLWIWGALGSIDLDPCAATDTRIGKVNWAIDRGQDGLARDWVGFVYCNPPFSQKELWAEKMMTHGNGIIILPERGSAPWFGVIAEKCDAYWVMGKKIDFVGGPSSNNLGSCLFAFGIDAVQRLVESGLPGHLVRVDFFRPRNTQQNATKEV